MDHTVDEEKKEGIEEATNEEENSVDDSEDEELVDLPPEITEKLGEGRMYNTEEDLQNNLIEKGFGDLRVVLVDGKPRQVMPSDQHNTFTANYVVKFTKNWGKWGFCSGTNKIYLQNSRLRSRDPDLSYWGYPLCRKDKDGDLRPLDHNDRVPIPDVVIQFSWKNKRHYEEKAIDDMMTRGLEFEGGDRSTDRPRLGYLIKVQFSKKRKLHGTTLETQDMVDLDIYRLPYGTTIADACDPNNTTAEKRTYKPGGPEEFITITPEDLGITGFWALLCGEYKIKASDIFEEIHKIHTGRQSAGLAT